MPISDDEVDDEDEGKKIETQKDDFTKVRME